MVYSLLRTYIRHLLAEEGVLDEPKRQITKSLKDLGIRWRQGKSNIIKVYNEATPAEKDYWGKWYHHAKTDVQHLASKYDIPFEVMAAIVATLSPGNKWKQNIGAAERLLTKAAKINAYPRQVLAALAIKESGDTSLVSGPKVSVFYRSLIDPESVENELVLDSHAINIWFGKKVAIKETPHISQALRERIKNDYLEASKELGVPVQQIQAISWYIWKYTPSKLPAAPMVPNPEVN